MVLTIERYTRTEIYLSAECRPMAEDYNFICQIFIASDFVDRSFCTLAYHDMNRLKLFRKSFLFFDTFDKNNYISRHQMQFIIDHGYRSMYSEIGRFQIESI